MDLDVLREEALYLGGEEEAVTVNTRALIDKVLARYSSEWTVLRELVANAADAGATKVTIRFTTWQPALVAPPTNNQVSSLEHVIRYSTLRSLQVTNNGNVFADSDWKRLKSIAEGNPDEQKIGAFGVGFYSVFADCENPLVLSGSQGLDFYWKGNALFTRKLLLKEYSPETSFVLNYRDSMTKVPDLVGLYRFLATNLTFVNLHAIELWLDDWNLLALMKNTEDRVEAAVPRDTRAQTKNGLMQITKLHKELVRMSATAISPIAGSFENNVVGSSSWLRDGSPAGLGVAINYQGQLAPGVSEASVYLRMLTANIATSVTEQFASEIERATRKPPPKTTKLSILRSSTPVSVNGGDPLGIFDCVIPSKSGKIFIGFPTHQTTGLLAHISLNSVIPTVERESIDLNARWVRDWNTEMLRVAGIVARIAWDDEMRDFKERVGQRRESVIDQLPEVLVEATHVFEQFAFQDSTPYSRVGQIIQDTFWCAGREPINVLSTHGVLPGFQVRIATDGVAGFVDGVPILPEQIIQAAQPFVAGLRANGSISDISIADIKQELGVKTLDDEKLLELLKWVQKKSVTNPVDAKSVLASAHALTREARGGDEITRHITLGSVRYYVNDDVIPSEFPVGLDTIPLAYTKIFSKVELHGLGWHELPLKEWIQFLVSSLPFSVQCRRDFSQFDIFSSPECAGNVLRVISRRWNYITTEERQAIVDLLKSKMVMPTKLGIMAPTKSYLSSVTLFTDLANVTGVEDVSETVLVALGVQKMVELSVVLKRLKSNKPALGDVARGIAGEKWSFADLVGYLVTVSDQFTPQHIATLQNASICHAEGNKRKWYKVSELYEPADTLKALGLRVLDWPGTYRPGSREDVLLRDLGLKQFPTVPDLVQIIAHAIAAGKDSLINRALEYFVNSFAVNKYHTFNRSSIKTPYLPLEGQHFQFSAPAYCFMSKGAASMGYPILRRDLQPHAYKFGVVADPPISWCLTYLTEHPPRSMQEAVVSFSYLGCRPPNDLEGLDDQARCSAFVPIFSNPSTQAESDTGVILRYASPQDCYVGDPKSFGALFDFVDFTYEGNRFLQKCGAQFAPSCWDVGYRFVQQPCMLLEMLAGMSENYKYWLQWLADRSQLLRDDMGLWNLMKTSPFLLGERPGANPSFGGVSGGREAYFLKSAKDIVIVDDYAALKCFRSHLFTAPRNRILEQFYLDLGSESLSQLVQVTHSIGGEIQEPLAVMKMQNRVMERASFFLSEIDQANIKVNAAQLKEGLKVKATPYISLRRTLKGYDASAVASVTAAVPRGGPPTEWTLWFTPKGCRIYDVSAAIAQVLLHHPTLNNQLSFDGLMSMEVAALETYGYDVSRILIAQKEELRIAEDQRRKDEELKMKLQAEGLLPVSTGTNRYPFGSGDSFANESSITQSLNTAVEASRAFKATNIYSAGSSQQVKEKPGSTYCDVRPGKDLTLASSPSTMSNNSLPLFLPQSLITKASAFLHDHSHSIQRLTATLFRCADALGISRECLHVFFEEKGVTVAFNRDGSLFFNLRAWEELGHGKDEEGRGKQAERYWFVVFCHELAHNLVQGHGPEHGFWTETLIIKNMAKLDSSPPAPGTPMLLSFGNLNPGPSTLPPLLPLAAGNKRHGVIIEPDATEQMSDMDWLQWGSVDGQSTSKEKGKSKRARKKT